MNGFVIFGYYGQGNLGDETNLRQLVTWIKENNPKASVTVISANPEQTGKNLKVKSVGKFHWPDIICAIQRSDLLIGGGGSLFQDRTSLRSLIYYSSLVFIAKLYRVPIVMYGQGIGPLRSFIGRLIAGRILSLVNVITVRDRLSIITLAELNVRRPEIFITAEPLLLLNQVPPETVLSYWQGIRSNAEKRLRLGFIIQEHGFLKRKFWSQLIDCMKWDHHLEIFLIPADRGDLELIQSLANSMDLKCLAIENSWEELQRAVGGLDLVVSTRLHGLVAAVVQNIPCFGIAVDPKIEGFCMQIGIPFLRPTSKTEWLTLGNRILGYLYQPLAERKPWEFQVPFWKARAYENQIILKRFIIPK